MRSSALVRLRQSRSMTLLLSLLLMAVAPAHAAGEPRPLRIAVVGLVHGHVRGFLDRIRDRPDVELVALVDPDQALLEQYRQRYGLAPDRAQSSLEGMLDAARPEAVAGFPRH